MKRLLAKMVNAGISEKQILSSLSPGAVRAFHALQRPMACAKGEKLFTEGGEPCGLFVLSKGRARVSISDLEGRVVLSRKAARGEVLGLSSAVSGQPHQMTAQALTSSELSFIRREDFLRFLHEHADAAFRIVELLSGHLPEGHGRPGRARVRRLVG
ncbi:MAG TPA: cyclic nucleotide-binding domain-containing protein [Terriglobia bacterium]|nr:cyclic nucleotide-binding domain-containing protein [Terriglobia bacterium]